MRKVILLLVLLLTLSACGQQTAPTESTTVEATQPPYESILSWQIPDKDYFGIYQMGANLVLLSTRNGTTEITLVSPDDGSVLTSALMEEDLFAEQGSIRVGTTGICYFSRKDSCLVFLNSSLDESRRVFPPDMPMGAIILENDRKTACYSNGSAIISMDLETGISARLALLENMTVCGSLFDGDVLLLEDETGTTCRFSVSDGSLLPDSEEAFLLRSDEGCCIRENSIGDITVQCRNQPAWQFSGSEKSVFPLSQLTCIVAAETNEDQTVLRFYDMFSGSIRYTHTLPAARSLCGLLWNTHDERIWFCSETANGCTLTGVAPDALVEASGSSVFTPFFTPELPDIAGLAACQSLLDEIGREYGITIRLGDPDFFRFSGDYRYESAFETDGLEDAISRLRTLLARLPENFLRDTLEGTTDKTLHIGLFRSIRSEHAVSCPGPQFWVDGKSYIALSMDALHDSFYHGLGHIVASRVHSQTSGLDDWEDCNPYWLPYPLGYEIPYEDWLTDIEGYFVSPLAASYPTEDWAETFCHAMLDGQNGIFDDDCPQKKLMLLCRGIRKAYGLRSYTQMLPWEQYCKESLIPEPET